MIASEIMNRVATISSNITLQHAAKIMSREGIGSLVLMKGRKARGIITERDIIKNISKLKNKVSKVMNKKLITITEDEDLEDVVSLMKKKSVKRILITGGPKRKVIGIVTATDIIANADLLNQDVDFL